MEPEVNPSVGGDYQQLESLPEGVKAHLLEDRIAFNSRVGSGESLTHTGKKSSPRVQIGSLASPHEKNVRSCSLEKLPAAHRLSTERSNSSHTLARSRYEAAPRPRSKNGSRSCSPERLAPSTPNVSPRFTEVYPHLESPKMVCRAPSSEKIAKSKRKISSRSQEGVNCLNTEEHSLKEEIERKESNPKLLKKDLEVLKGKNAILPDSLEEEVGEECNLVRHTPRKSLPLTKRKSRSKRVHSLQDLSCRLPSPRSFAEKFGYTSRSDSLIAYNSPIGEPSEERGLVDRPVKVLGKKEAEHFEKSITDYLDNVFKRNVLPPVSHGLIRKSIYAVCRREVELFVNVHPTSNLTKLYKMVSNHAVALFEEVQKGRTILGNITKRLAILARALDHWQKVCHAKTIWSESLSLWLKILCDEDLAAFKRRGSESSSKVAQFLSLLEEFKGQKGNEMIYPIIFRALGDSPESIERTFKELKIWSSNTPKALQKLDKYLKIACSENILAVALPYKEHVFPIESSRLAHFFNITPAEIYRCIKPDEVVLFDKIKINGRLFHQAEEDEINSDCSCKDPLDNGNFWKTLFKAIYQNFQPRIDDEAIEHQVSLFRSCRTGQELRDAESKIPCLKVLKLISNSCWGIGSLYLMDFFPGLTESPYWLKYAQGIECAIEVASAEAYEITQIKTCIIYPRLNPADQKSFAVDDQRPLAKMRFAWTVKVENQKWTGKLQLLKSDFSFTDKVTEKEKWHIRRSLMNYSAIQQTGSP